MKLFFAMCFALAATGARGQIYIDSYRFQAAASTALLLDDYPNATGAWSLRKLRAAMGDSCIQVRNATTTRTFVIGFVNNYLDTIRLKDSCGVGVNCFVRTWYDQSGNARNLTQTTDASQPQIISNGAILSIDGQASIAFDGTNDVLRGNAISQFITASTYSNFSVAYIDTITTEFANTYENDAIWTDGGGYAAIQLKRNPNRFFIYNYDTNDDNNSVNINLKTEYVFHQRHDNGVLYGKLNNDSEFSVSSGNTSLLTNLLDVGADTQNNHYTDLNIKEIVFWNTSQSSNIAGILNHINNFYAIY